MKKNMRNLFLTSFMMVSLVMSFSNAVEAGHYSPGTNGGAEGWVPPPGLNVRFDVISITADALYDQHGNRKPVDFDLDVLATVPSLTYSTREPVLLGARYGARIVIPVADKHLQITAGGHDLYSDPDSHALGDIDIQPIMLGWGGPATNYDSMLGVGVVLPTGDYERGAKIYCGEGYYSAYLQGGANYFFDGERSWYVSGLFHLLYNGEQEDTDIEVGEELIFEYGVGKIIKTRNYMFRLGLAGYGYWKLEADEDPADSDTHRSRVYGLGPEIELVSLADKWSVEMRCYEEFEASNSPEGEQVILTWVKAF